MGLPTLFPRCRQCPIEGQMEKSRDKGSDPDLATGFEDELRGSP